MLAQHYRLDTDNKSGAAIQDYLNKIKRRNKVV